MAEEGGRLSSILILSEADKERRRAEIQKLRLMCPYVDKNFDETFRLLAAGISDPVVKDKKITAIRRELGRYVKDPKRFEFEKVKLPNGFEVSNKDDFHVFIMVLKTIRHFDMDYPDAYPFGTLNQYDVILFEKLKFGILKHTELVDKEEDIKKVSDEMLKAKMGIGIKEFHRELRAYVKDPKNFTSKNAEFVVVFYKILIAYGFVIPLSLEKQGDGTSKDIDDATKSARDNIKTCFLLGQQLQTEFRKDDRHKRALEELFDRYYADQDKHQKIPGEISDCLELLFNKFKGRLRYKIPEGWKGHDEKAEVGEPNGAAAAAVALVAAAPPVVNAHAPTNGNGNTNGFGAVKAKR